MSVRPVSFGSLMVFTINDGKPKADVPSLLKTSFAYNKDLSKYHLLDTFQYREKIDGTVHNASKDFALKLDRQFQSILTKGSNRVQLTEADFYVNPRETQKRYFLTAGSKEEETALLNILNKGATLYAVKFN